MEYGERILNVKTEDKEKKGQQETYMGLREGGR